MFKAPGISGATHRRPDPGGAAETNGTRSAGARIGVFSVSPSLPGAFRFAGAGFVITTTEAFDRPQRSLPRPWSTRANASHMFWFVDSDLKIDKPQDDAGGSIRDLIALMGLNQQDVASALTRRAGRRAM